MSTFQPSSSGVPHPSMQWRFNDVALTSRPGLRLVGNDEVIEIGRVRKSDEGTYVCTAANDAGEDSRTHVVVVLGVWTLFYCSVDQVPGDH